MLAHILFEAFAKVKKLSSFQCYFSGISFVNVIRKGKIEGTSSRELVNRSFVTSITSKTKTELINVMPQSMRGS